MENNDLPIPQEKYNSIVYSRAQDARRAGLPYKWKLPYPCNSHPMTVRRVCSKVTRRSGIPYYYWRVVEEDYSVRLIHENKMYYDLFIPPF